jgi:ABC-type uncharacterized transport system ATPase subunit
VDSEKNNPEIIPERPHGDYLLRVVNLSKRFPGVLANNNISFDVRKGEIHCLLGENGAGKSTLTKCIYGAYKPDSGQIFFKDSLVEIDSPRDALDLGIGMVQQHFVLLDSFSIAENIILGTQRPGTVLELKDSTAKIQALCATYGVCLDLSAKIIHLSVGEQQWVEILKALYLGAELLILDEPTAVLTPQETEQLFSTLKRMTEDGLSIIFITHKLREVLDVADRITVLRKGNYIDTVNNEDISKKDLARMMVGRDVVFRVDRQSIPRGKRVLEIADLWAKKSRNQMTIKGISLELYSSEILGIAGVAGNGQKELFEVLIGARPAERGSILLNGIEITDLSPKDTMHAGLAHIPQDRIREGLISDFTVAENLILGKQRKTRYKTGPLLDYRTINSHARDLISLFKIDTPSELQKTATLSGGNLQKVILARELEQSPMCLIANQPTRGLDVGAIEQVHTKLLEQRQSGVGIMLFSEDLEEIFTLSDRIAVIYEGQITGVFNADEVDLQTIGLLMAGIDDSIR